MGIIHRKSPSVPTGSGQDQGSSKNYPPGRTSLKRDLFVGFVGVILGIAVQYAIQGIRNFVVTPPGCVFLRGASFLGVSVMRRG